MFTPIKKIYRLFRINMILLKHGLDELVLELHIFDSLSFLRYLFFWHWLSDTRSKPRGIRIREALVELGPIFIKFGQMLSTRRDLLPNDVADELAKLQDEVPPFDSTLAQAIIEKSLKAKVQDIFAEFSVESLASASVAQVHAAKLNNGDEVVIKVLRPGIKKTIQRDIGILYTIARLVGRYSKEFGRLKPVEVVHEFERTILDELNLEREAANASHLRRNFQDSEDLYVPKVYWDYTKRNVMVMERIYGIPIANMQALKSAGVDFKRLSERGVEIFFTQVFRDCFFHADMHPGNIFVDATQPSDPKYIAIDCGIIGTLSAEDQRYLAANFLAFFNRDYQQIAKLHVESGWVKDTVREADFAAAIRTVCEPIFEKPLKEISFGHFLLNLFQTARRFEIEVQPQLVLLQKTLLSIEGLGRELYPDLDLWATAKPYLEGWMKKRTHPKTIVKYFKENAIFWVDKYKDLPELVYRNVESEKRYRNRLEAELAKMNQLQAAQQKSQQRIQVGLLGILVVVLVLMV